LKGEQFSFLNNMVTQNKKQRIALRGKKRYHEPIKYNLIHFDLSNRLSERLLG